MTRETDVFISGGGMVGLTLALALARGGLKAVVADPMPVAAALDAKFDGRVSRPFLFVRPHVRSAGRVGRISRRTPSPSTTSSSAMPALDRAPSPFSLHFDHREIGQPLGHIAENRHIRAALSSGAVARRTASN